MIRAKAFAYSPLEHENEKASNSYVMSLVALIAGLPFPIINLIATLGFYMGNRKGGYFTRWHCTQALLSQFSLLIMNSLGFWWTFMIIFGSWNINNGYLSYILTIIIYNILEFIATIYTAIQTRKGIHIEWWFYGNLTNLITRSDA